MAVFFGPYDEDYGYITLEAMLAAKPVITCRDSGGPLEFVQQDETGWVVEPDPKRLPPPLMPPGKTAPHRRDGQGRASGLPPRRH